MNQIKNKRTPYKKSQSSHKENEHDYLFKPLNISYQIHLKNIFCKNL